MFHMSNNPDMGKCKIQKINRYGIVLLVRFNRYGIVEWLAAATSARHLYTRVLNGQKQLARAAVGGCIFRYNHNQK